ncbi:MAG: cyanophycin synthetase [Planctomycetota bacterium]
MTIDQRDQEDMPTATNVAAFHNSKGFKPAASVNEALQLLLGAINYERKVQTPYTDQHYRLDRMRVLASVLGNPQDDYAVVHVAGSKGKGSASHLVAAALQNAGYPVGLYTSPHLVQLHERFRFNGQTASDEQIIELANSVLSASHQLLSEQPELGAPTFFELSTAMAMLHFSRCRAKIAVLEVGLGGRLDSTNICKPTVCCITSIGLDHEKLLGTTIEAIAGEKAGIIKNGVPVICSARHPDAQSVVKAKAKAMNAALKLIGRDYDVSWKIGNATNDRELNSSSRQGIACVKQLPSGVTEELNSCMIGAHHADNIAAAWNVIQQLAELGFGAGQSHVKQAVLHTQVPARLEVIARQPTQILDTAHNPSSIEAGLAALEQHFPSQNIVAVFSPSRDKDCEAMLRLLLPRCSHIVLTEFQENPRAFELGKLAELAANLKPQACQLHQAHEPKAAYQLALALAGSEHLIYATGSFFLAAEILAS